MGHRWVEKSAFCVVCSSLGSVWGPRWVNFWSPAPPKTYAFLSKTPIFGKSRFSGSGCVLTTFLVTLGWLVLLLSTIFDPPACSLERSGHSRGVARTPQDGIPTLLGRSSTAYGCSGMLKKWQEAYRKQVWLTLGRSPLPRGRPGQTLHQNPRFFVNHCAYLA